jgi:4-amino-4-deoxy-L-arabinose transferase-like glycosyltransferase
MSVSAVAAAKPPARVRFSPLPLVLLGSALLWSVLFSSIGVEGQDFPLNDDWAFGRGALSLARGDGIHYFDWAAMPQLGQWLWACPFVWALGPSCVALRISTIVLSWLGLWAFYDLLRQQGRPPAAAALAAAALALNPLFVVLQGTFMTDVPALSFSLIALALYRRAIRSGRPATLAAAVAVMLLGVSTRQNTAVVAVVAAVLLWRARPLRFKPVWVLGVVLPALAAVAIHVWLRARPDVRHVRFTVPPALVWVWLLFSAAVYAGLSVLSAVILSPRPASWKWFAAFAAVLAVGAWLWWRFPGWPVRYDGGLFPYMDNMLSPWGAFAASRYTGRIIHGDRPLLLDPGCRFILTVLGCGSGAWLLARIASEIRRGVLGSPLVLFTLLQIPLILAAPEIFDRYVLFLFPGALALAVPADGSPRARWVPAAGLVALFGAVSAGLMHDWLAWNSARWELGRRAVVHRHIDPHDIEGGFEWDGWFCPDPPPRYRYVGPPGLTLRFSNALFGNITGRYALSFSRLPQTRVVDTQPYHLWLLPGHRVFYLLEFAPPAAGQPGPRS